MEQVREFIPKSMKKKFPNCRCFIECVEFEVEVPSSLYLHKMMYSDHKSRTTAKVLVDIIPGGGFSFISQAFPGSTSDKEITLRSDILNPLMWSKGNVLMTDRGFTICEYTDVLDVELIIPAFLKGRDRLSEAEIVRSQQIAANERIHVERMIQRLNCYHVFDRKLPLTMVGSINQIITVCSLLCNFQEPIVKQ